MPNQGNIILNKTPYFLSLLLTKYLEEYYSEERYIYKWFPMDKYKHMAAYKTLL